MHIEFSLAIVLRMGIATLTMPILPICSESSAYADRLITVAETGWENKYTMRGDLLGSFSGTCIHLQKGETCCLWGIVCCKSLPNLAGLVCVANASALLSS